MGFADRRVASSHRNVENRISTEKKRIIQNIFNKIKTVYKYISCFCANFAKVWHNVCIHLNNARKIKKDKSTKSNEISQPTYKKTRLVHH